MLANKRERADSSRSRIFQPQIPFAPFASLIGEIGFSAVAIPEGEREGVLTKGMLAVEELAIPWGVLFRRIHNIQYTTSGGLQ